MLPQWHVKDPGYSAKSAGGRLHLSTHTPLTERSRSGLTMPQYRHCVETYQGTGGHSRLSSLSHCGLILAQKSGISVSKLISTKKKIKKEAQAWNELSNILPKSLHARKKPPPHQFHRGWVRGGGDGTSLGRTIDAAITEHHGLFSYHLPRNHNRPILQSSRKACQDGK